MPSGFYVATKVDKEFRSELQKGNRNLSFTNDQLTEFIKNDVKNGGIKHPMVHSHPDGSFSFVLCRIEGKTRPIQVFFDSGCNCSIMKEGVPQREFNSILLNPGPINIDVASGIKVYAKGECGMSLPLDDGSAQAVHALALHQVKI